MIRLVFLDFDGVLNHSRSVRMDLECIREVDRIVTTTRAKLVISSGWRETYSLHALRQMLRTWGLRSTVSGVTPIHGRGIERGTEIRAFLDTLPKPPTAIVALDDWHLGCGIEPFLVRTTKAGGGLTPPLADLAIATLLTPPAPMPWREPFDRHMRYIEPMETRRPDDTRRT